MPALVNGLGVSICLDMISIETFDLNIWKNMSRNSWQFKKDISINLDKVYALKSRFGLIFDKVSIETLDLDV